MVEHVLFLRHFETQLNAEERISGRSPDIPILESREILCDFHVDSALCSPAVRCRQTLEAFLQKRSVQSIHYVPELAERHMGIMEGCLRSDMEETYPDLFDSGKFRLFETPPGGESFEAFQTRVRTFWEKYQKTLGGTLLICSHNQFLKMMYLIIHDLPVTEVQWKRINFPNGTIEKVL